MKLRIKSMIWNIRKQKATNQNKDSIRRLWGISKCASIQITGVPEGEEKDREIENLFENIMKENLPNLAKEIDIQVQEVERVPKKVDPKRTTPRHIIIKCQRLKIKRES